MAATVFRGAAGFVLAALHRLAHLRDDFDLVVTGTGTDSSELTKLSENSIPFEVARP